MQYYQLPFVDTIVHIGDLVKSDNAALGICIIINIFNRHKPIFGISQKITYLKIFSFRKQRYFNMIPKDFTIISKAYSGY